MSLTLGINNCFAVKRWPRADQWAEIVAGELGLEIVQHSFDLIDFSASDVELEQQADDVRSACERSGIALHSTFTGLAAYSASLLLAPEPPARRRAVAWYERAIRFTAAAGASATGGHLGSLSVDDFADHTRASRLWAEMTDSLDALRRSARNAGLDTLLVENMACAREPSTMDQIRGLLDTGDAERAAVALCLDVGHQVVPGTGGAERDPYAWLRELGERAAVVHLQQSDAESDHHWPFTERYNAVGRIDANAVIDALAGAEPALIIEVIPPFEADDAQVLDELRETVSYWRAALARSGQLP